MTHHSCGPHVRSVADSISVVLQEGRDIALMRAFPPPLRRRETNVRTAPKGTGGNWLSIQVIQLTGDKCHLGKSYCSLCSTWLSSASVFQCPRHPWCLGTDRSSRAVTVSDFFFYETAKLKTRMKRGMKSRGRDHRMFDVPRLGSSPGTTD